MYTSARSFAFARSLFPSFRDSRLPLSCVLHISTIPHKVIPTLQSFYHSSFLQRPPYLYYISRFDLLFPFPFLLRSFNSRIHLYATVPLLVLAHVQYLPQIVSPSLATSTSSVHHGDSSLSGSCRPLSICLSHY